MNKVKDLTGQQFGLLTVLERAGSDKRGNARWLCKCNCGNVSVVRGINLRTGRAKSCGCLIREGSRRTHGGTHTRLYIVWKNMKARCTNPQNNRYKDYGGRDITVCAEWLNDFSAFQKWALRAGYDENAPYGVCTLDRIDNDKGYSPDNCRWATAKEQIHNRRPYKKKKKE